MVENMELKKELTNIAQKAQAAARNSLTISTDLKNKALKEMAKALMAGKSAIISANKKDLVAAQRSGLSKAFIE
ncbi:MAG: gamma-glutamyl-phosphate reductase, partial [Candidatus Omnitrophica bacterium]|nr:gamma-glutamyl-phosphate reductase [Candidatus Omnitrophota bacterium]